MKIARLFLFCILAWPLFAAAETDISVAGRDVAVWLPEDSVQASPVILFSHGFHGCNTQSVFLMEALAKAGYAVFAPNHADATCNHGRGSWLQRSKTRFKDADQWSDATYNDRKNDMEALLDALLKDKRYSGLDWKHVGLAGHSLGGYTVLALAGAWPSWKDARVTAVLALSPYVEPFIEQHTLGKLGVPVMYQGGTRDFGITPSVEKQGGAYDQSSSPKWYVKFESAGHLTWAGSKGSAVHDLMSDYAVSFFNATLKNVTFPSRLIEKPVGVADFRYQGR